MLLCQPGLWPWSISHPPALDPNLADLSARMFLIHRCLHHHQKTCQFLGHHHHSFYPFQQLTLPKFLLMFLSSSFNVSVQFFSSYVWFFSWPPLNNHSYLISTFCLAIGHLLSSIFFG